MCSGGRLMAGPGLMKQSIIHHQHGGRRILLASTSRNSSSSLLDRANHRHSISEIAPRAVPSESGSGSTGLPIHHHFTPLSQACLSAVSAPRAPHSLLLLASVPRAGSDFYSPYRSYHLRRHDVIISNSSSSSSSSNKPAGSQRWSRPFSTAGASRSKKKGEQGNKARPGPSVESSPPLSSSSTTDPRHYNNYTHQRRSLHRPGPLGTVFLLFPAVAIGVGVASGWISINPFSSTTTAATNKDGKDNNNNNSMSSKLIPANPAEVMVIRDITPNVVTLSVPFKRFGMIPIGGRGTIVKLTSGSLAVFSPVALTPDVQAKVAALGGNVKYLIAPDIEHHIFLTEWHEAWPEAKLIGPEGLPEKRAKQSATDPKIGSDEQFAVVFHAKDKLSTTIDAEFDADFAYEYVDAHANKELVFYYKPDKVLIEADLMFNLPADEQYSKCPPSEKKAGFPASLFVNMQSTEGEAKGMKRFLWYVLSKGDRQGFNESIARIDAWDFETLIPCHGETIVGNAKETWGKVFEWHLHGKK